jgi:hypothetical protein
MKPSELMLKGYAMAGDQCEITLCVGDPRNPTAVCAIGAIYLADNGNAYTYSERGSIAREVFRKLFDSEMDVAFANNNGMAIEDIAGILASEGY